MIRLLFLFFFVNSSLWLGCGSNDQPTGDASQTIPNSYFTNSEPPGAQPLHVVKQTAKVGEEVVFQARVGGTEEPLIRGRALMVVADEQIRSCDQISGDGCPTPWDYCCESKESLQANRATVQLVDASGQPIPGTLQGSHGIEPLKVVVVKGKVVELDGNMVVNASQVYVKP